MALGARGQDILAMVLREAGTLLAVGLAAGAAIALASAGSVRAFVFGVEPHNVGIIGLACLLLGATAIGASFLPARRDARLPPLTALRED